MNHVNIFEWLKNLLDDFRISIWFPISDEGFGARVRAFVRGLLDEKIAFYKDLKKEYWRIEPEPDIANYEEGVFTWNTRPEKISIIIPVSVVGSRFTLDELLYVATRAVDEVKVNGIPLMSDNAGIVFKSKPGDEIYPDYVHMTYNVDTSEPLPVTFTIKRLLLKIKDFKI